MRQLWPPLIVTAADGQLVGGGLGQVEEAGERLAHVLVLGWKFMSCCHVKNWVNLLS